MIPTDRPDTDGVPPASDFDAALVEGRLRASREAQIEEDLDELAKAARDQDSEREFTSAVEKAWLADLRGGGAGTDDATPSIQPLTSTATDPGPAGTRSSRSQTALLGPDPSSPGPGSFARKHPWTSTVTALAAAALLTVALRTDPTPGALPPSSEASAEPAALGSAPTGPVYLGTDSEPTADPPTPGSRLDVSMFSMLPETVDFEEHVPKVGPYKVRVTRLGEEARIDESPFEKTFDVYEPRWTCPPSERAQLPQLIQLEIRHGMEVPGSSALWTTFFKTR